MRRSILVKVLSHTGEVILSRSRRNKHTQGSNELQFHSLLFYCLLKRSYVFSVFKEALVPSVDPGTAVGKLQNPLVPLDSKEQLLDIERKLQTPQDESKKQHPKRSQDRMLHHL